MAQASRQQQTRAYSMRPSIGPGSPAILHVDTSKLPRDLEVMWATKSVLGSENLENIRLQMGRGFYPVLASEMPDEASQLLPGQAHSENSLVERGGLVLMKRPRALGDEERGLLAADNAEVLRAVNRDFEQQIAGTGGFEQLAGGGVVERTERSVGGGSAARPARAAAFPE